MLSELNVTNFRCFDSFFARDLAPINLIVGKNNVGKTCLLEALELIATGNSERFGRAFYRRREVISTRVETSQGILIQKSPDVRCAFRNRATTVGTSFQLKSIDSHTNETRQLSVTRVHAERSQPSGDEPSTNDSLDGLRLSTPSEALDWTYTVNASELRYQIPIRGDGGIFGRNRPHEAAEPLPVRSIHTDAGAQEIAALWDPIAATEHEDEVIELLKIVEPRIEKIAATTGPAGSMFLRIRDERTRVPMGSFGDGTTRLFSIACNLIASSHGILLIDEIDTGLHFSTIAKMWRFLSHAAKRLDLQVFATTHSKDCLAGLARFCVEEPSMAEDFRLHRLERDASTWTTYSAEDVELAMDADIEVR